MLKEYMTTTEAAEYLGFNPDYVCSLCKKGSFSGAIKFGSKMWAIPEKSVHSYEKNGQGGAAIKARKEKKRRTELEEINAAIKFFGSQKLAIA
ncbi:MAG: helix-turn-helix domain-containing protein [Synergistaceae bacterium]|nr:helix-turn-helix domain-containing protein [Synergistaceae bacterium]